MGADGHLEGIASFVVLTLLRVQDRQVVVGLRQFRVVVGQLLEDRDGFGAATEF